MLISVDFRGSVTLNTSFQDYDVRSDQVDIYLKLILTLYISSIEFLKKFVYLLMALRYETKTGTFSADLDLWSVLFI